MKRPYQKQLRGVRSGDIRKDLSQKQLALVGAIALVYNEIEANIESLFFQTTKLIPKLQYEIITRLNIDDVCIVVKAGLSEIILEHDQRKQLSDILGPDCLIKLKGLRNAVVHTRLMDATVGIGKTVGKRAKISEVLMSESALNSLFQHLDALKEELHAFNILIALNWSYSRLASDDPRKSSYAKENAKWIDRVNGARTDRLSLPPLPEFPEESELREAETRWLRDQISSTGKIS